ncbi:PTS sugar transporter subunit IIA [uncultured Granulicatella sp.]|uniref:PTS sugar transporter subunit IIA n=1 Tax=uncultured Granulicatella sp. TaxID=316089 RepID=UPI0028DB9B56|nr:PTS sugar transporter subunit IIA [uncultured Granulicatella sp.]
MQILIVTHGELAAGFKDAAEVIFGDVKGITTIGLHSGESVEVFGEKIYKTLSAYDENESILILADLLSASPYNQSVLSVNKLAENRAENIRLIAGVNLPMVLEGINQQLLKSDLDDVVKELKKYIISDEYLWKKTIVLEEDEDEDF